ncbi:redoxin domain-containing protein [Planctomicrobium sp. SH664]|uniref:redoxin domain-containing protein n=1 Tax=Planctomicrobium sp. SH664 TaxID=3448125 RepID=UPI003F5C1D09
MFRLPTSCRAALLLCLLAGPSAPPSTAQGAESPLHQQLSQVDLQDIRGSKVSLSEFRHTKVLVVAFLGTECPLAKLYSTRLQQLSQTYPSDDVRILGVMSNSQDSLQEIAAFAKKHELTYPLVKDVGHKLADALGATRTPEVVVLDALQQIRYQGRIDDQYQIGVTRDRAEHQELKNAIDEILAGKAVTVPRTAGVGCLIGRPKEPQPNSPVTYSNQIARIFQAHCIDCHRKGDIGPFEMTNYEDLRGWGETILEVVEQNRMPPWFASPEHGKFANDCRLSETDKQLIRTWVAHGCPEGNRADLPEPKPVIEGWQLPRVPDRIIAMRDAPFTIPADAGPRGVEYQNFWINPKLSEDVWVNGLEVLPGNRAVVHHIIVYMHPEGRKGKRNSFLTAYVPGLRLENGLPAGAAKRIPAGAWLRFQVHYTPNGSEQQDLSRLGWLEVPHDDVTHEVQTAEIAQTGLNIQPFLADQEFKARSPEIQREARLLSLSPHMHLRGQSFRYEFLPGKGQPPIVLLDVPNYDFNWQTRYVLAEPLPLHKGSWLRCVAKFDNSEKNLANPDPAATVRWGDQSWDEMMIGYFDVIFPVSKENSNNLFKGSSSIISDGFDLDEAFTYLDKNKDGFLSPEECKRFAILEKGFPHIDVNNDKRIDKEELAEAFRKYGLP